MILAICLLSLIQGQDWHYVVPAPGADYEHAPAIALSLLARVPDGVEENVEYRGERRRYTQLRYGSPGTTRIAIAVDELADGTIDLYVDADRDRKITAKDRIEGSGRSRKLALALACAAGSDVEYVARPAYLEFFSHTIAFAPIGFLEGHARLGDRSVLVRRVDANGNASYSDPGDRLLVDHNGDGRFDPFDEVFLYQPVLTIAGARWIVRETPDNDGVSFVRLEGTGQIELTAGEVLSKRVQSLTVTLQSEHGITVGVDALAKPVEAPVGRYRVVDLDVQLADPDGGAAWGFVFSAEGAAKRWYEVTKDKKLQVDPFSGLELDVGLLDEAGKPGQPVNLRPRLVTGDGLLINSCWRGMHIGFGSSGPGADIVLAEPGGGKLDDARSGFL